MWNLKQSRLIEAESSRVARGWGRGNGEIQVKRYRAAVRKAKIYCGNLTYSRVITGNSTT